MSRRDVNPAEGSLAIARELALPIDAATQVLAFLGRRGSGKTYGATKTAECMLDAGVQVVVLDPVGAWWGLRLAANGEDPGISIPIFGGLHGDIPLEPTAGALLADVVVDRGISAVLDVSQMIDTEQRRFAHAFGKQLFQRKKASPSAIFLFLEECQEFVPQNPQQGEQLMLHEFKRIGKLGRNFGIGLGLLSQRPQAVSKEVLNLTECMFAFQMTGPQERKAIAAYVSEKGADLDIVDELPRYAVGECHVWSPQWLQISKTIRFAKKRTFDASSTPKVGAAPVRTRELAPVDLAALEQQMAETIERAKDDDPKALRTRIRELEAEIKKKPAAAVDESAIAGAVSAARRRERAALAALHGRIRALNTVASALVRRIDTEAVAIVEEVRHVSAMIEERLSDLDGQNANSTQARAVVQVDDEKGTGDHPSVESTAGRSSRAPASPVVTSPSSNGEIPASQQRVLDAIAFYESLGNPSPSAHQVAAFIGVNPATSTWRGYLAPLRNVGFITDVPDRRLALTSAGRAQARATDAPKRAELLEQWASKVSAASAEILRAVAAVYPASLSVTQVSEKIGVDASTSTWRGYMAQLRKLGLLDTRVARGEIRASELLFPEGVR